MMRAECLGLLPRQPDAGLLARANDRNGHHVLRMHDLTLVSAETARSGVRAGTLSKAAVASAARERVVGRTALAALVDAALIVVDPPYHGRLRSIVTNIWPAGGASLCASVDEEARELVRGLPTNATIDADHDIGIPMARVVVAGLLGVCDTEILDSVVAAAPLLDQLIYGTVDLDEADARCARAVEAVITQVDAPNAVIDGRLLSCVAKRRHALTPVTAAALVVFTAAAAVETTRVLSVECICAAGAAKDLNTVLRWASPVPFALYGDGPNMQLVNLGSNVFGFGPHYCLGARVATTVGDAVLDELGRLGLTVVADGEITWSLDQFTRRLNAHVRLIGPDGADAGAPASARRR